MARGSGDLDAPIQVTTFLDLWFPICTMGTW